MNHSIRQAILEDCNYMNDHRVIAGQGFGRRTDDFDRMTITYHEIDFRHDPEAIDGADLVLPAEPQVCETCRGRGKHVNPSIDANGLTREDFHDDPDFAEAYFSGQYDVTCYDCNGKRVTLVVDYERADPSAMAELESHLKEMAEMRATEMAERRMGA